MMFCHYKKHWNKQKRKIYEKLHYFFFQKHHSCRSFIFCFPCGEWARRLSPTVSYLWTVEAYLGPLATASHSEAESVAICSTVTTSYSLDSELDDFCLLLSILWTLWITSKTFVYCFPFREQWKHLHIL